MERINPTGEGSDPNNWAENSLFLRNGRDADGNQINGTPKAENSASQTGIEIDSLPFSPSIDSLTFNKRNSPFILKSFLTIPAGKSLTIQPGVVVKGMPRAGIQVEGTLIAQGSGSEKIVFTSIYDDDYGGDTNNDGSATTPSPGDWGKIYITQTSNNSVLDNIIVRYGGGLRNGPGPCSPDMAGILIENNDTGISNALIEQNQYRGVYLLNSSSSIENVDFNNNPVCCSGCHNEYGGWALAVEGGNPSISNSSFENNPVGIYIESGNPQGANLTFGSGGEANTCNVYSVPSQQCYQGLP